MKLFLASSLLAILAATPALANQSDEGPLAVSVGYAEKGAHPGIWAGVPHVTFIGTSEPIDGGAIKLHDQTPFAVKVVRVTVDLGDDLAGLNVWSAALAALPSKGVLKPGEQLVLTQTAFGNFNTSDMAKGEASCARGFRPVLHVTEKVGSAKPITYSFLDASQILSACGNAEGGEGTEHWTKVEPVKDAAIVK